ncbi:MAG: tetratricopeptide repeat protein [Zoogloeaceae bacterium]|nr:tetratricopeptide repeat protein [Zoogloeaceae bacterium]
MKSIYTEALHLIDTLPTRRPAPGLPPILGPLFGQLPAANDETQVSAIEDRIWEAWMYHPNRRAAQVLEATVADIAAQRLDIAETRLVYLLRSCPDYAEAWNKLATVYYLRGWDGPCIKAICHTLSLEPRHFGALAELGEVFLARDKPELARRAFEAALRIHPQSEGVAQRVADLGKGS